MEGLDFLAAVDGGNGVSSVRRGGDPVSWFEDDADMDYTKENVDAHDGPLLDERIEKS